jgi:hypothetical protein
VQFWEYVTTLGSFVFDSAGNVNNPFNSVTQPGVGLSLAGNDVIVQTMRFNSTTVSSVSSPYGNFLAGGSAAAADSENNTSGAAPTWTAAAAEVSRGSALAISEVAATSSGVLNPKSKWVGNAVIQ